MTDLERGQRALAKICRMRWNDLRVYYEKFVALFGPEAGWSRLQSAALDADEDLPVADALDAALGDADVEKLLKEYDTFPVTRNKRV